MTPIDAIRQVLNVLENKCAADHQAIVALRDAIDGAARRPWVGLTEEEQDACLDAGDYSGWRGVMNAVESKLREKNT